MKTMALNDTLDQLNLIYMDQSIKKQNTLHFKCICYIYIYNGILLSLKKNKILPLMTIWMDLEGIKLK